MATINYRAKATSAAKLITKFGQAGVVHKIDAASGQEVGSFATVFVVMEYDDKERDGDLIRQFDRKVIMAAGKGVPTAEDRLQFTSSNETVQIVASRPLAPAGIPVIYELQVRS